MTTINDSPTSHLSHDEHGEAIQNCLVAMTKFSPAIRAAIARPHMKVLEDYTQDKRDIPDATLITSLLICSSLAFTSPELQV